MILISMCSFTLFNVCNAAVSGTTGTSILTVVTKANWYKSGQESITLQTKDMGYGARAIYNVYLDGSYMGTLGNPKLGKYDYDWGSKTIYLKRNKTHKIRIVYDANATRTYYKKKTSRTLQSNIKPYWYVSRTHKVANYY